MHSNSTYWTSLYRSSQLCNNLLLLIRMGHDLLYFFKVAWLKRVKELANYPKMKTVNLVICYRWKFALEINKKWYSFCKRHNLPGALWMLNFNVFVYCLMLIPLQFMHIPWVGVMLQHIDPCEHVIFLLHKAYVFCLWPWVALYAPHQYKQC